MAFFVVLLLSMALFTRAQLDYDPVNEDLWRFLYGCNVKVLDLEVKLQNLNISFRELCGPIRASQFDDATMAAIVNKGGQREVYRLSTFLSDQKVIYDRLTGKNLSQVLYHFVTYLLLI